MECGKTYPDMRKYQASSEGRIKSLERVIHSSNQNGEFDYLLKERILRPGNRGNYQQVVLNDPRQSFAVHHLVMAAFVGERDGMYVLMQMIPEITV